MIPLWFGTAQSTLAQEVDSFAVIAGQTLTNTGPTTIIGNIAVSPGTAYTGSGSVTQTGTTFLGDAVAIRIQNDLTTLYTYLSALPTSSGGNLTGRDLGGLTLRPGVYNYDSSALLSSGQTLTLDAEGNPAAIFIINVGSTLTVGSGATVILQNGAQGGNVFYRVGSSATLDTTSDLQGQIVALTSITMNTASEIGCGSVFARNGAVTLDTNRIGVCVLDSVGFVPPGDVVDEPVEVVDEPGEVVDEPGEVVVDDAPVDETPVAPVPRAAIPDNTSSVLTALIDHENGGGVLPLAFTILPATQTPEELAETLSQLVGEVSTGIAPTVLQSMNAFIDTVSRPGRLRRLELAAPRDQGIPAGMVPNRELPYAGKYDTGKFGAAPVEELTYQPMVPMRTHNWDIWMSGYGARNVTDGDAVDGTHDNTINTTGLAFGAD